MSHMVRYDDLSAYVDGELGDVQRAEIEAHVKECAECRQMLADFERASAELQQTKGTYLAESFVFSVRARIRSGSDTSVSWVPAERLARHLVLGLALVVIAVTGLFWNGTEPATGVVESYFQVAQQDSVLNQLLNADNPATKDELLLAVMGK
jgi:anti-sigma factor RsiW